MGLPLALKAHDEGNLVLAEKNYERALSQGENKSIVFQNYGSLLKSIDQIDKAKYIYLEGLALYPDDIAINTNLANLYKDLPNPLISLSIKHYLQAFASSIKIAEKKDTVSKSTISSLVNIVALLRELGLVHLAYCLIYQSLRFDSSSPSLLVNVILLIEDVCVPNHSSSTDLSTLRNQILDSLEHVDTFSRIEILFGLANHSLSRDMPNEAFLYFDKATSLANLFLSASTDLDEVNKVRKLVTCNGWNLGCTLLKLQDLSNGWKLFDHGLMTPAEGKQRWQRALSKPFSNKELSLWRGESLIGKSLLLLEEQAIGDVMMFCSLLLPIANECKSLSLLISDRLLPIYRRVFSEYILKGKIKIFSRDDYNKGLLNPSSFDLQLPIGSICQHRFVSYQAYSPTVPCLIVDEDSVKNLRSRYMGSLVPNKKLIGVSWRGGGKGVRIQQKSVEENQFFELLTSLPDVQFISLQYGKYKKLLRKWQDRGLDIIADTNVDPLSDMDTWLSQVSLCDSVLSVANTTIHASGGLNIPTMCLLSKHADWRWINDTSVTRSYWYPSVGIARASKSNGWDDAFETVQKWVSLGCPMPKGPMSSLS